MNKLNGVDASHLAFWGNGIYYGGYYW